MNIKATHGATRSLYGTIYLNTFMFYTPRIDPMREATIEHERVHIIRQGNWVQCTIWLLLYRFSKKFRIREESLALAKELRFLIDRKLQINYSKFKSDLVYYYRDLFTDKQAADIVFAVSQCSSLFGVNWVTI